MITIVKDPYCARFQYDGFKPFWFGTFIVHKEAQYHEIEGAAWAFWDEYTPSYVQRPKLIELTRGALIALCESKYVECGCNRSDSWSVKR